MIFFGIKNRWTHLRKKHDKEKDLRNEAFLSKIQLGEKIIPCIIIVVYYEEHFGKVIKICMICLSTQISTLIIIQCDKLNYVKIQQIMIMMK